jgi:DNA-3-methyladenine glycosylase
MNMKLPESFYRREDTVAIARELLGKCLFTEIDGLLCGGIIIETEAYIGPHDMGSHSYNNRRTTKNEMMYSEGGVVYMYICYGIHDMLNVVTGLEELSHAVLIRALQPEIGIDIMRMRRNISNNDLRLCQGPGALAKAIGVNKLHNGVSLQDGEIWIEDKGIIFTDEQITAAPRVGLNIPEPYKSIPWRFYVKGNKFVSKPNK